MLLIEALWFYLPALAANQMPGCVVKIHEKWFRVPLQFPISVGWLGKNKTWAAYPAGIAGAIVVIYLQRQCPWSQWFGLFDYERSDLWLIGGALGFGAILGDHLKSFAKRCWGTKEGSPWWPWDQIDYVLGSLLLAAPLVWIGWVRAGLIVLIVLLFSSSVTKLSHRLGIKRVPW